MSVNSEFESDKPVIGVGVIDRTRSSRIIFPLSLARKIKLLHPSLLPIDCMAFLGGEGQVRIVEAHSDSARERLGISQVKDNLDVAKFEPFDIDAKRKELPYICFSVSKTMYSQGSFRLSVNFNELGMSFSGRSVVIFYYKEILELWDCENWQKYQRKVMRTASKGKVRNEELSANRNLDFIDAVELKPNFFGIGINFNFLLRKFLLKSKRRSKK